MVMMVTGLLKHASKSVFNSKQPLKNALFNHPYYIYTPLFSRKQRYGTPPSLVEKTLLI